MPSHTSVKTFRQSFLSDIWMWVFFFLKIMSFHYSFFLVSNCTLSRFMETATESERESIFIDSRRRPTHRMREHIYKFRTLNESEISLKDTQIKKKNWKTLSNKEQPWINSNEKLMSWTYLTFLIKFIKKFPCKRLGLSIQAQRTSVQGVMSTSPCLLLSLGLTLHLCLRASLL